MDRAPYFRDIDSLIKRVDDLCSQLLKRYINILVLARVPRKHVDEDDRVADSFARSQEGEVDRNQAALNSLKMDVETQGLIRASESLLTLARQMKELWLFGQLDTLGKSDTVKQTEKDALAVAEMIEDLRKKGQLFSFPGNGAEERDVNGSVA